MMVSNQEKINYFNTNYRIKIIAYKKQGVKGFIKYIMDYFRKQQI